MLPPFGAAALVEVESHGPLDRRGLGCALLLDYLFDRLDGRELPQEIGLGLLDF